MAYRRGRDDEYRYTELQGARPIRLLFLYPGDEAAPLVCEMKTVSLNEKPIYEALSYVWGSPENGEILQIRENRKQYSTNIRPSLADALRHLRKEDEDLVLWVDAVCIDQDNGDEKSQQVRMMDDIFHSAERVHIWLGNAADDSDEAIEFIHEVTDLSRLDRLVKDPKKTRQWFALSQLMQREWFTRRWVIQELALAKATTLHCGSKSVGWAQFADAVSLFTKRNPEISRLFRQSPEFDNDSEILGEVQAIGALSLINVCNQLFRRSEDGRILNGLLSLEALVAELGIFKASSPHDIIYALLSLAGDVESCESFAIDYTESFNEVAKRFIEFAINSSQSLDILCRPWAPEIGLPKWDGTSFRPEPLELPSWICPLSNAAYDYQLNKRFTRRNADNLLGSPGKPYYHASRGLPTSEITFTRDGPQGPFESIFVRGIICSSIEKIGDPARSGVIPSHWFDIGGWSTRKRPVPEEFWRTIVADRGFDGVNPAPWYSRACEHAFCTDGYKDDVDTKREIEFGRSSITAEFLQRVQAVVWKRRIVLTDAKYLGLVPEAAKEGDHIAILCGCSVPVVLRAEDSHYKLIGQSYIHGLMDGPNLPKWKKLGRVSTGDTRYKRKAAPSWNGDQAVGVDDDESLFGTFHKSPEPSAENLDHSTPQVLELR